MRRLLLSALWLLLVAVGLHAQWLPDTLGNGFEKLYIEQPRDYSGAVKCTVVRKLPASPDSLAVLYVHGYNDYFFQTELADSIVARGYGFYALDLRKYGRSLLPENTRFEVRDLREYFPDIDSAIAVMKRDGVREISLMGHSTGGLITASYMASDPPVCIRSLILNSPFLDWNLGKTEWLVPAVSSLGRIFPHMKIKQSSSTAYVESLLAGQHGEWRFNTDWKLPVSPPVEASWVRAIDRAQKALRKKQKKGDLIRVPVLLMMSERSVNGSSWTPEFNRADAVLDVRDIRRYGIGLSDDVTVIEVDGGLHDLFLSAPEVRTPLYSTLFNFIGRTL